MVTVLRFLFHKKSDCAKIFRCGYFDFRLSNFVENFSLCFPYYPLHFLLVCFRMVLQNLYSFTHAADIPTQEHAGCFCCNTEYRLLFLLPIFGKEL